MFYKNHKYWIPEDAKLLEQNFFLLMGKIKKAIFETEKKGNKKLKLYVAGFFKFLCLIFSLSVQTSITN